MLNTFRGAFNDVIPDEQWQVIMDSIEQQARWRITCWRTAEQVRSGGDEGEQHRKDRVLILSPPSNKLWTACHPKPSKHLAWQWHVAYQCVKHWNVSSRKRGAMRNNPHK